MSRSDVWGLLCPGWPHPGDWDRRRGRLDGSYSHLRHWYTCRGRLEHSCPGNRNREKQRRRLWKQIVLFPAVKHKLGARKLTRSVNLETLNFRLFTCLEAKNVVLPFTASGFGTEKAVVCSVDPKTWKSPWTLSSSETIISPALLSASQTPKPLKYSFCSETQRSQERLSYETRIWLTLSGCSFQFGMGTKGELSWEPWTVSKITEFLTAWCITGTPALAEAGRGMASADNGPGCESSSGLGCGCGERVRRDPLIRGCSNSINQGKPKIHPCNWQVTSSRSSYMGSSKHSVHCDSTIHIISSQNPTERLQSARSIMVGSYCQGLMLQTEWNSGVDPNANAQEVGLNKKQALIVAKNKYKYKRQHNMGEN